MNTNFLTLDYILKLILVIANHTDLEYGRVVTLRLLTFHE